MKTQICSGSTGGLVAALALGWAMFDAGEMTAGEAVPGSLAPAQTVTLSYREVKDGLATWYLTGSTPTKPFKAEPNLGGRKAIRGVWHFGSDAAHALAWVWDDSQGKLYLDLNRNQDLTDDPAGVFSSSEPKAVRSYQQTFKDVRLTFQTPMGTHPLLGNLHFYRYGGGAPSVSLSGRSYWAGRFSARGRDWEVGLCEEPASKLGAVRDGHLILRRWETRDESLDLQDGSLEGFPYQPEVFFGKQLYRLSCRYLQRDGAPKYELTLTEQAGPMGELQLSGQYFKRVVLQRREPTPATVVLDLPEGKVQVPAGRYDGQAEVVLKQGGVEAYREVVRYGAAAHRVLTVPTNQPVTLVAGGPLTNSVAVSRRGGVLTLDYRLVGAAGDVYQLRGARKQPEFAVVRAGKKIASGKFEFG